MLAPLTPTAATALLSPSARVLAASARPDGGVQMAPQLPWSDVHWPTLVALGAFERADGQLCRLLRSAPPGAVPDDVQRALEGAYRVALFRAAELADGAAAAIDALSGAGVEALWLKGAALAMQSADGFSLRSMGDLDVLVDPVQLTVARAALRGAGWSGGAAPDGYATHHHDAPMLWRGGLRLELHSALFPPGHPFADDSASTWLGRGRRVTWGAREVVVLPAAWHVVHAAVHWAWCHEGMIGSWQYLHDMHRLSSAWLTNGPEWLAVIERAELSGAALPVGWALWTAARLANLPVPESAIATLRGRPAFAQGMTEREWIVRAFHSPAASPSVAWSRFWWRRAMHGLGSAEGAWPWTLGHGAAWLPETGETFGVSTRERLRRWRRHLVRVVGS